PYSLQWTVGIQQQLGRSWTFETSYVGNHALNLTLLREINRPDRVTGLRPAANLGTFNFYDSSESSHYDAWPTSVGKRFANGLGANFHYPWARSLSYTSEADLISPPAPQESFDLRDEYGPSLADIHHRFTSDFVYEAPFEKLLHANGALGRRLLS